MPTTMTPPTRRKRKPSKDNCTVLDNLLTVAYVAALFRRSELTIWLWRRHEGLPYVLIPGEGRAAIRFDRDAVLKWARRHQKRTYTVRPAERKAA